METDGHDSGLTHYRVDMYDPTLVDVEGLTKAVAAATGFSARLRAEA